MSIVLASAVCTSVLAQSSGSEVVPPAPTPDSAPAGGSAAGAKSGATDASASDSNGAPASAATPATPATGAPPAVVRQISHWEDQFFTRQYVIDDVDKRLGRIEQLVFGAVQTGGDQERIGKLKAALNQQGDGPALPAGVAEFVTPAPAPAVSDDKVAAQRSSADNPADNASGDRPAAVPAAVSGIADDHEPPAIVKSLNLEDKPMRVAELHVTKKQFATVLQPQRVIQNLSEAIRDNPKDPELVYQRAKAFIQVDKLDRALGDLSDAIEMQPNLSDFYLARAFVYHLMGNSVMQELDLSRARFVDPHFPAKVDWE